jgi:hypothetical protein
MRLAVLASSTFALCLTPLFAQSGDADLRAEIRRIVREEVRAALKDAMKEMHSTPDVDLFIKDENGLPGKAIRIVPVEKAEKIDAAPAKIRVVTPEKVKSKSDGDETMTITVLDGTGRPVTTKVLGSKKVTAKTVDGDGDVHVLFDDGTTKRIVVTPDQLKHRSKIVKGKAAPTEHEVEFDVVGTEAEVTEQVKKAVGECCEALEKCCEAVEECKGRVVEMTGPEIKVQVADPEVVIEDVTTGMHDKAAQKAKKAKKAEKKKAKKQKEEQEHEHENGGGG